MCVRYLEAVKHGFAPAEHNLAIMYRHGLGGEIDLESSMRLLNLAASHGKAESHCAFGSILSQEKAGDPKSYKEAMKLSSLDFQP